MLIRLPSLTVVDQVSPRSWGGKAPSLNLDEVYNFPKRLLEKPKRASGYTYGVG
jgi:hypothetical protein